MDKHRNEYLDSFIGKRVAIKRPQGLYFGIFDYANGYYFIDKPDFRNSDGVYIKYAKWSCRKSGIRKKDIRKIGDAPIFKG